MGILQPPCVEPDELLASHSATAHQPGAFEHLHMFGGACEAHREGLGERPDRAFPSPQRGKHAAAGRVGKSREGLIEQVLFNHKVEQ